MNRTSHRFRALSWGAVALVLTSCDSGGESPFLRKPPDEQRLWGVYSLSSESAERIAAAGYHDATATVEIRRDGTFVARRIPSYWLDVFSGGTLQKPRELYDTCSGTWLVEKPDRGSVYDMLFYIDSFADDSAYSKGPGFKEFAAELARQHQIVDGGVGRISHFGEPWSVGIVGLTTKRSDYGLALPLNHGDHEYIIFDKRTTEQSGEPDGAANGSQPIRSEANSTSSSAGSHR